MRLQSRSNALRFWRWVLIASLVALALWLALAPARAQELVGEPEVPIVVEGDIDVSVYNFNFMQPSLTIDVGDSVAWHNSDGFHNINQVTSGGLDMPGGFGNTPGPYGWQYTFTFDDDGTYYYQCDIHPVQMQGSIEVRQPLNVTVATVAAGQVTTAAHYWLNVTLVLALALLTGLAVWSVARTAHAHTRP